MYRRTQRRIAALVSIALAAALFPVAFVATPAAAATTLTIQWTEIGIYPHSSPTMSPAARVGAAVPDGTQINVVCELEGESVSSRTQTSTIWEKTDQNLVFPNVYVDTGHLGWTPGIPRCGQEGSSPSKPSGQAEKHSGVRIDGSHTIADQLLDHYYDKNGKDAIIDWSYFQQSPQFVAFALTLPVNNTEYSFRPNDSVNNDPASLDMLLALGTYSVRRTSQSCFVVRDYYDFAWGLYSSQKLDAVLGAAKEFTVWSSGCL